MARFKRMAVFEQMYTTGLVPVFYHSDAETVCQVVEACAEGGATLFEFTNRGDRALHVFSEVEKFCAKNAPHMITGIGSIVEPYTAMQYINEGASFIVGPSFNEETAKACNRRKIAYSPGCATLSEISKAEEMGCEIVKIFPGESVGGPEFVQAIKAPCPWVSVMPTGGVDATEASIREWFTAGIVCAGIGSKLISKKLIEEKNFKEITKKVRETLSLIKEIKSGLPKY